MISTIAKSIDKRNIVPYYGPDHARFKRPETRAKPTILNNTFTIQYVSNDDVISVKVPLQDIFKEEVLSIMS